MLFYITPGNSVRISGCIFNSMPAVIAIIVTRNRFELLKECISAVRSQTSPCGSIIVVNNGSTDETNAWLAAQSDLRVITQENSGSAGGQCSE